MDTISRAIAKIAFWRWPKRIRALEEQLADMQQELWDAKASEQKVKVHHRTGMFKIMKWIHTTHRLDKPASGIRALLQKSGFAIVGLLLLCQSVFGQAPFQRNPFTTNPPAVSPGVSVQGLNNISITNVGSGTSWWFYAVRPQTVARLIDVTNIIGAISAGTNALVQTNGVNIGSIGTLNFNAGVTGFVSGSVVTVGVTATGGGDAGGTNARQFGTLILTNLGANPIPYTNILVADVGIQLGTNSGITYITNISGPFLTNWANAVSNLVNTKQASSMVLSNLVGTVARNVTNVVSLSTTNATSKPLTNSYTAGVLTLFGLEEGANITLTPNGSNIVIATSGAVGEANVNGEVSLTNNANGIYGIVYDKAGITNRLKSISQGNGIIVTNNGTNLPVAIDPAVVASQSNLTTASNKVMALQVWTNDVTGAERSYRLINQSNFIIGPHGELMNGMYVTQLWAVISGGKTVATNHQALISFVDYNRETDIDSKQLYLSSSNGVYESTMVFINAGITGRISTETDSNGVNVGQTILRSGDNTVAAITHAHHDGTVPGSLDFSVDGNGNIDLIRGVGSYLWPGAHANGALTNDGSGNLGWWAPVAGSGEVNVNGEVSVTNSTRMGWVFDKSGVTNRLRSIQGGNGILLTNESTNIMVAIDPAVVASQANLTAASNTLNAAIIAATNSASVTNWINSRQPASANLTNWSLIPTGSMANVVSTTFLTNWANSVSNLAETKQNGSAVLTNLVGTVARNVTNVVSLSTTNATSKPLTNSYANGVLTLFGLEEGANVTLTPNGSNIVIATSGAVGEANVNGEVSLTNNANGIYGLVYDKVGITNRIKSISAGANIVITNAGTNLWIASTAISGFVSTNMLFVSPTGDNATAERNSQVKPYQTISNALANALAGDVVKVLPGNYVQGTNYLNVPNNVHLVGSGIGVTTIEGGITLQSGSAINPGNNSYLSDFTVTTTNQGGSTIGTFPFVQKSFTNIVIDNVRMVGHSDSLFISHSNRTSGEIRNSIVESDYDSVVIIFATNSVWNFNNSTFLTRYPWESDPVVSQGTGLQLYKGTAYVSQCTFKIAGTNQNVGIWVHNDARAFVGGSHFIVETNTIVGGNSYDVVANDTSFIHMDQPIDQGRIVAFGGQVLKNQTNIFLSQITASNKLYFVANGATNKWPLTNALATQVLTDVTGNGQLSWATPTGSGEANVNGEVSLTNNANGIYGLVYDKVGITNRIKAISAGANIVITNAGTNLWIASTASGGSILTTNMVYVSPTGDDATGTRNDPNKPFSTLTNAMAATKAGDVVFMYPGSFTIANNIYLDISNNVSLIGSGRQATWVYSDVDLAVIGAAIVPGNYSYIANFSTSNKTTFGAPMGSDISGGPQKSFTNAIIDSVDMWGQSDVWYVFEFPGPNEPCTYEIRNCGLHSSFDFIVHQSTSDSVFKVTDTTFDGIGPYTTLTSPQNGVKNNAGTMFMSGGYMNIFGTNANRGIINAGGATSYVSGVTFKVTGGPGGPPNYPQVLDMTNLFGGELYLASPYEMSRIGGTVSGPTNLQLNIITSASGVTNVWPKTQGAAKSILTNDGVGLLGWSTLANAGVGTTSLTTNANQFGAQTMLTIKEGALLTNILVYPSNLTGPAIISTASAAQITNLMEWRQTNGSVGLAVSSNGLSFVGLYLNHSNAVAFRTNNISLQLNQNQTFTNGLKTNLVLQLTNSLEGVTVNLDAYGAGRLGGVATNAWQLLCVVPAGNFIYWPPGSTNGNFDVLVNSNQIVTLTFRCGLGASNILASYLVREGIGAN